MAVGDPRASSSRDPRRVTVALPVAIYLMAIGVLHARPLTPVALVPVGVASILVLAAAAAAGAIGVPLAVLLMGLIVSVLVAVHVADVGRTVATPA